MEKVTLGGDRLGSGKKQEISLHNYERSSHDLSYVWRSSMASGTLVPFMTEVGLPGDAFDIDLNCVVKTLPTLGPLFGSYKVQLDVFQVPIRLYNGKLHMNMLGIGMDMSKIKLPLLDMTATTPPLAGNIDNYQINSSSIFSYLNIRGLGCRNDSSTSTYNFEVKRKFNAVPYLAYFDIYKQYFANKQEEIGYIVHNNLLVNDIDVDEVILTTGSTPATITLTNSTTPIFNGIQEVNRGLLKVEILINSLTDFKAEGFWMSMYNQNKRMIDLFSNWVVTDTKIIFSGWRNQNTVWINTGSYYIETTATSDDDTSPQLVEFPLSAIDDMRKEILGSVSDEGAYIIGGSSTFEPYTLPFKQIGNPISQTSAIYSKNSAQEGLLIKTYQSDLFNNWISTEWIEGENGINALTSIDTSEGFFTIDTLQLSRKLYDVLNRIAISGGSYDDWLNATWAHDRIRSTENPMYCGGLSKELVFEEIFSQSQTEGQPLGTLAGKGTMTGKHKGGKIKIRIDEPSYIMGIVSITPRIDYSQGNKWDVNLKTLDDLHKPGLDEIGFQDLITDQMHWVDTGIVPLPSDNYGIAYKSAGKQPAWINYMTNVNQVRGDFAIENNEMYMVLNRRYEVEKYGESIQGSDFLRIKDLTTYVDPSKFNFIFAETKLNAMNFWTQIKVDVYARRKMSAKLMPNL